MSVYRRAAGGVYHVEVQWRGFPRLRLSTGATNKARAEAMERTLHGLKANGRRDILGLLKAKRLRLADVHEDVQRGGPALERRLAQLSDSPALGTLTDAWLAWLASPAALSKRSRRPFAPATVTRYQNSWARLFAILPLGREARLDGLTRGFLLDYRAERLRQGAAAATVNRDLCAVSALWSWCERERKLVVPRAELPKEREPQGRERWLAPDEITALRSALPAEWWPLFGLLVYTGLRIGEAQGLEWADLRLADMRIRVTDRTQRLKTVSSNREVPLPRALAELMARHRVVCPGGPADPIFRGRLSHYPTARRIFRRACLNAGLHDGGRNQSGARRPNVTIHDLRHTFGVHAAQAGVPIPRLQKLLGHASAHMTMRYAAHSPEAYLAEDGARIEASLSGARNREADAQAALARASIRPA